MLDSEVYTKLFKGFKENFSVSHDFHKYRRL